VGKPTRPIRSLVGFHIVLVEKRSPSPISFDQARPKLEQRLRDEQPSDAEMESLIKRLRQRATIQRTLKFTDDDE
jgi:parvulin-like peptidyl-prolyl isomerase